MTWVERAVVQLLSWIPADIVSRDRYFDLFQRRGFHTRPVRFDQTTPGTGTATTGCGRRAPR